MCGHRGEGQRRETVRNELGQLVVTQNMNPAWSESRKALGEIEDAWLKRTGSSELPGGGGLLREWHAFRDAWQLARETVETPENTSTWQCGCGNWNGVNLPNCAVCGRNRNSDQRQ